MIDLHSHFLYGVDDGARDQKTMITMLRHASDVGIKKLLATPHANEHVTPEVEELIKSRLEEARVLIAQHNLDLDIALAAEVNFNSNLQQWMKRDWVLFGDQIRYMLFELPMFELPSSISDILFAMGMEKIKPVLAHPERNHKIRENPEKMFNWIAQGCLMQVDAGSITGQFGKKCQLFADNMLHAGAVHLVASDAHDNNSRNYSVLSEARQRVAEMFDDSYAEILFNKNPGLLLNGQLLQVPEVDESVFEMSFFEKIRVRFNAIRE